MYFSPESTSPRKKLFRSSESTASIVPFFQRCHRFILIQVQKLADTFHAVHRRDKLCHHLRLLPSSSGSHNANLRRFEHTCILSYNLETDRKPPPAISNNITINFTMLFSRRYQAFLPSSDRYRRKNRMNKIHLTFFVAEDFMKKILPFPLPLHFQGQRYRRKLPQTGHLFSHVILPLIIFRGTSEIINGNDHAVLIDCKISCQNYKILHHILLPLWISPLSLSYVNFTVSLFLGDHRDCPRHYPRYFPEPRPLLSSSAARIMFW